MKNRGPDPVPSTEVIIQWPFEAPSGKHLLYLIDVQVSDSSHLLPCVCLIEGPGA